MKNNLVLTLTLLSFIYITTKNIVEIFFHYDSKPVLTLDTGDTFT